jgi:ADP-ribosylglycohydrolase
MARHWASGPERGYSTRTTRLLGALDAGTPWSDVAAACPGVPARASNGAAVRVTPATLYAAGNVEVAVEIARRSAGVTHPHPGAHAGACVHAAAVAVALSHPAGAPLDADRFVATVGTVSDDPALGGDTDTIAAMTGALASALLEEPAIPKRWVDRAEAAPQVRVLADQLFVRGQPTERQR